MDTCWAGRGTLIGSMVPPTDPWYEDLTGLYPYDLAKAKALRRRDRCRQQDAQAAHPVACRMPSRAARSSRASSSRPASRSRLDQLEFPAVWLGTVFTDADYDMSIVAHVEPRDLAAVFGNPDYYTRYDNKQLQADLAAADAGSPAGAGVAD